MEMRFFCFDSRACNKLTLVNRKGLSSFHFIDILLLLLYIRFILKQVPAIIFFLNTFDHSARVCVWGLNFDPQHSAIKTIFPKELRVQSAYD